MQAWIILAITAATTAVTVLLGVFGLGWRIRAWVGGIHNQRTAAFIELKDDISAKMDAHEVRDARRHEENLVRFGVINERLARMGNGRAA